MNSNFISYRLLLLCILISLVCLSLKYYSVQRSSPDITLQWDNGKDNFFWSSDPECSQYRTRFVVRHSLQTRALVSYPGSGNSWTRYLLEASTGIFTGSIYNNKGIINAGLYGEARAYNDGSTILQKTHHTMPQSKTFGLQWRQQQVQQFGGRGVLVIRNPYKAVVSFYNYARTGSQTKSVSAENLATPDFHEFVRVGAGRWLELIQDWLLFSSDCYVVLYEDLKDDPIEELKKLLSHLRVEIDPGRLDCIDKHSEGSFHRSNKNKTEDPFTQELHQLMDTSIRTADNLLRTKTGRGLPLTKYQYYNGQSV